MMHDPGQQAHPWMSWSNAAVPSAPDTEYHFPNGSVLSHSSHIVTIGWKSQGPRREADIKEMTGYFWRTKDANAWARHDEVAIWQSLLEEGGARDLWRFQLGAWLAGRGETAKAAPPPRPCGRFGACREFEKK